MPRATNSSSVPASPPLAPVIDLNVRVATTQCAAISALAQRVGQALVRTGAEAIQRDREGGDAQLGHEPSWSV